MLTGLWLSGHYFHNLVLPSQFCKYPPTCWFWVFWFFLTVVVMPVFWFELTIWHDVPSLRSGMLWFIVCSSKSFQSSYANISLAFLVTGNHLKDHFQDLRPHCTDIYLLMVPILSWACDLWGKQTSSVRKHGTVFT